VSSRGRQRPTIRQLAEYTGLSPAAVSYALRGMHVSAETEDRVRAAAEELGYEADPIARALAGGETGVVGLLVGSLADFWNQ
jgi:LacI family transcriptional regulator, galactose operon repressor